MKFGHFDDARKEYVITTPRTPLPWINYLGSEDFFSLVSNTAGGYSFYRDAKLLRLTRYRYNGVPTGLTHEQKEALRAYGEAMGELSPGPMEGVKSFFDKKKKKK